MALLKAAGLLPFPGFEFEHKSLSDSGPMICMLSSFCFGRMSRPFSGVSNLFQSRTRFAAALLV
jgi:hypothetical protein